MYRKNNCKICNSCLRHPIWKVKDMRYKTKDIFRYFQCINCGCLQIENIPDNISDYYPKNYYSFQEVSKRKLLDPFFKKFFRNKIASVGISRESVSKLFHNIISFPKHHEWFRLGNVTFKSNILDIGSGNGSLLIRIMKEGFVNVSGIDPFIQRNINYENGLKISKATLNDLNKDAFYDFIMMHHSLEHIPDQFKTFQHISRLLKKGGMGLIRIPVSNSFAWKQYRMNWVQLDAPRHLFLHSENSINILATSNGLKIKKIIYDSLGFQFFGSELCERGILIQDHKLYLKKNGTKIFSKLQLYKWKKRSKELNKNKTGDMCCFYLSKE